MRVVSVGLIQCQMLFTDTAEARSSGGTPQLIVVELEEGPAVLLWIVIMPRVCCVAHDAISAADLGSQR